jgi:hypothetical protein
MASDVDIANRALQKLGAARITSLTEDSVQARACNLCYEPLRDAELRAHPWNFSIKRAQLAADATAPLFGPATAYTLPVDFLRLLPPDPVTNYNTLDWKIEGKKILTDETGALDVRYIYRVTDAGEFDALFIEALSARMAVEMCEELTQSNTKAQLMREDYKSALREARKLNAFENIPAEQQDDTWITARL